MSNDEEYKTLEEQTQKLEDVVQKCSAAVIVIGIVTVSCNIRLSIIICKYAKEIN